MRAFGEKWMRFAVPSKWNSAQSQYVDALHALLGLQPLEHRFSKSRLAQSAPGEEGHAHKRPRNVAFQPQTWNQDLQHKRVEIVGDSRVVIN